jgi:oligoribonuclease NrnB/cAMP/cGMP phosphodiesterase (DHH superfamily)
MSGAQAIKQIKHSIPCYVKSKIIMNNNFLVFSHEQHVDGLFSAAVLRMTYPQSQIILTNYGFENMLDIKKKVLSFIKSVTSGTIMIADIGVNHESYSPLYEALSISKQRGFSNI